MPDYRAALGRGGDSMMGHLTPGEAIIPRGSMTPRLWAAYQEALDRQGMAPEQYVVGTGANSINPTTGQPEFLAQASLPGKSVRDYKGGSIQGPESGDSGASRLLSIVNSIINPEMGGSPARASQQGMIEHVPQEDWAIDPDTGMFGEAGVSDVGGILGAVGGGILGGPVGAVGGYKLGTGEFDQPVFTEYDQYGPVTGTHEFNIGAESESERRTNFLQGMTQERAIMEESFARPATLPTPQFLGLSSAMSPLQMRTAIASRAIAGQGGEYTSPEAQAFYDNLLQRTLIGDEGDLFGLDTLLPIDLQYLAQIRGIENPADTQALLNALTQ